MDDIALSKHVTRFDNFFTFGGLEFYSKISSIKRVLKKAVLLEIFTRRLSLVNLEPSGSG